jgi:hypothetical protein
VPPQRSLIADGEQRERTVSPGLPGERASWSSPAHHGSTPACHVSRKEVRANLPWAIFLKDDKKGSRAPADESLGAIGLAVDAADPNSDPTDTAVHLQLMGLAVGNTPWTDPSFLRPAIFTAKTP